MEKNKKVYKKYNKFDVVYADFGDIPVHVIVNPSDVRGYNLRKQSDFMPEDAQTLSKGCIRSKSGYIPKDSAVREEIDRALIMQFDLLPVARKMVLEEMQNEGTK